MSIHYKFKNALNVDTVTFDGLHISVSDLKKSIIEQKQLGNVTDFDLKITNAQTKEEYIDETHLIPKNTSLIIARIPLAHVSKKTWDHAFQQNLSRGMPQVEKKVILDLSKMNGSEEEKIQAMMLQSSADYDPKGYQRIRGQTQTGDVPTSYRCNKCKKGGHWIKNCPYTGKDQVDVKRTTGIPKSFIEKDENGLPESKVVDLGSTEKNETIPEDLICSICKDIFTDAVMIPCCGSSFCDDCVRTSLLESEDNECPDCKEKGSSPGSLIPNRFLRNSVNTFNSETGYKRTEKRTATKSTVSPTINSPSVDELLTKTDFIEMGEQIQNNTTKTLPENCREQNEASEIGETRSTTTADIESDYEDNIIVTVPTALRENQTYKIRSHDVNHSRKLMPPGLEQSLNTGPVSRSYRVHSPKSEEIPSGGDIEVMQTVQNKHISSHVYNSNIVMHNVMSRDILPMAVAPGNRHDMYSRQAYHHLPFQGQVVRGPPINYNRIPHAPCNNYFPQTAYNTHSGYILSENSSVRPVMPSINLASVYQGVAAKVGSGVIDDPLEAFNRIMREKEREREHQRSPNRRRSTSADKNLRSRLSPQLLRRNRLRVSPYNHKDDRIIDTKQRDRRGYSREREKISERNRWRDLRKSRRNSRSRSRSIPTSRKILATNLNRRRYSRSKSPLIGIRVHQSTNSRAVHRSTDIRSKSPVSNFSQSRSLGRSFSYTRQKINQDYENDKCRDNYRGHGSELQSIKERNKIDEVHKEIFDISPPGTSEPPPPGFDNTITDLSDANQHNTESEKSHMPDIYQKYASKDFGDRKIYRRDLPSDRSSRSRSSKISSEDLPRQSRSRTVSKERLIKTEFISPNKTNISEINSRAHKEYESHVVKRRQNSDNIELKHDAASVRDESMASKSSKTENSQNTCKESMGENELNFVKKKEQKRFDKKEEKFDKKIKERKKKKKYKEEKERKKQKKKEKQSDRDVCFMDSSYNVEAYETRNSEQTPHNSNHAKIKNLCENIHEEIQELNRGSESDVAQNKNIHGYETDFDDFQHHDVIKTSTLPLPALSKWEREDQFISSACFKEEGDGVFNSKPSGIKCDKVTDEVLRRAENAIFSRDNKARHNTDISITCSDREKFSLSERGPKDNTERVQITIPMSSRAQRSIEIMENKQINFSLSPVIKKSVKDRLGSKIVKTNFEIQNKEPKQNVHRDRSRDRRRDRFRDHSVELPKDHSRGRSKDCPTSRSKDRRKPNSNERLLNRNENDKYKKQDEKKNEKNYQTSGEKSVSSFSSNSEMESDDMKQNKKRKHKKEKKRKKHSSSAELEDGSKKKHNKSKKKYKASKKNKNKI